MEFYWRAYAPRAVDRASPFAAPLRDDVGGLPPCLSHVAESDVLASENHAMAARLRPAGVAVKARLVPGTTHGFLRAVGHVAQARSAAVGGGAWLRDRFA